MALLALSVAQAGSVRVGVVDGDGNPVSGFRWVLQEDTTFAVDPNNPATSPDETLSLSFHRSNHPTARAENDATALSGNTDESEVLINNVAGSAGDPQRYYVSVLPYEGHSIGGAPVVIDSDGESDPVTVVVQQHPIPTAQIALFLFQDNWPVSGTPDLPEEENPGADGQMVDWSQFSVVLEEPAGRYGIAGGPVIQDAFGNPLGTTYLPDCDPYTADCVDTLGDGTLHPDATTGTLLIKNLAPGKYGVIVNPPSGTTWQQTSTIEGTKVIDAWVKANEPPFFVEFGLPGPHVFMGFVQPFSDLPADGTVVSGRITDMHMSRPPNFEFFSGRPFPQCWVALNEGTAVPGRALYAMPCKADSSFEIAGVPAGNYTLKVFDSNLDVVIATLGLTVNADGTCNGLTSCALGEVPVFNWFTRLKTAVFGDLDQDGFWDDTETGLLEGGPVNLRWRDGTIYQSFPADVEGFAPFDEVFPFFHWLVAEVGFTKDKATGATFVVDAGGFVDTTVDIFPGYGELTPQPQFCTEAQSTDPDDPDFGCVVGDPLINPNTGDNLSRTVVGPVLTQAVQGFLGQTSVMHFGKAPYTQFTDADFTVVPPLLPQFVGENGGISGMVLYATTRAEDDPELAVAEEWEPGVPRVQVNLYADGDIDCFPQGNFPADTCDIDWNGDGALDGNDDQIDDVDRSGAIELADVDNYPLGNFPGPEDVDRNANGLFDYGDALQVSWSDSWDDSLPTGCQGANALEELVLGGVLAPVSDERCFDGLRNFNQVRPGVFDGGWAFDRYALDRLPADIQTKLNDFYSSRIALVDTLPDQWLLPAEYIVEATTPRGYELVKEEHKNVDFGDEYVPSTQAVPARCVGDLRTVPQYLAMATKDGSGDPAQVIPVYEGDPDAYAPFALEDRPLCDRRSVALSAGQNAATDFFVMTDVPIAGNVSGMILNDLANEFNPNSPAFGEKYAPPFVPVAFYDWNGALVNRIYADEFGRFNAMVPSTYTANLPQPSGMSPNMLVSCMNDAGPIPNPDFCADPTGVTCEPGTDPNVPATIIDPFFKPQYSQFCYTFQYMPGAITYLDTPVVSIAAFANPVEFPVDCERPTGTPIISQVTRSDGVGPFFVNNSPQAQTIVINSPGTVLVPNPEWDGTPDVPQFIERDYRFAGGVENNRVILEDADGNRFELPIASVNDGGTALVATVPAFTLGISPSGDPLAWGDYQLSVASQFSASGSWVESPIGVTMTLGVEVDGIEYGVRTEAALIPDPFTNPDHRYALHTVGATGDFATIQAAVDAAAAGDLILVQPGAYDELVIMWKPVKLQGFGAAAVTVNARQVPTEKISAWRDKVNQLLADGSISLLPGQTNLPGFAALGAAAFPTEEGAGIFVAGPESGQGRFGAVANRNARIDGLTVIGASQGGGIVVNGYAQFLQIGNNRVQGNAGFYGGGVRLGHPNLVTETADGLVYTDAVNDQIRIHHNHIAQNGGFGGAGGGVSLHTGADRYAVQANWVCGNFTQGDGAGIGHLGLSDIGLIEDNLVIFNESFSQASAQSGGGIFVGGQPALQANADGLLLSPGAGNVLIDANLIRGNLAGAGDGGGIRLANVNGEDIAASLDDVTNWYRVLVFNNMINNNVAGLAGGGISMENALDVSIRNNTVANNDAVSTTALAFLPGEPNQSVPLPAGIVSRYHSPDVALLMALVTDPRVPVDSLTFSDPRLLKENIIWHNRSFYWVNFDDPTTPETETGLVPASCENPTDLLNDPTCDITQVDVALYTDDLGVLDGLVVAPQLLDPQYCLLTDPTLYRPSNITGDPAFVNEYFNESRDNLNFPEFTVIQTAGAFDEGGNFIQVTYGPLSLVEPDTDPTNPEGPLFDYHITAASPAIDAGDGPSPGPLGLDFDNDPRPLGLEVDIGADELQ